MQTKAVQLPNFRSVHINQKGEVFYLTPIGGHNIENYDSRLSEYQRGCLEISLRLEYNESGHLKHQNFDNWGRKSGAPTFLSNSLAKKKEELTGENHQISLWIQACHFIVIKSSLGRYWFLHYDPGQARTNSNEIKGVRYSRPNYSELRPILPYDIDGLSLNDDETIDVLVVVPTQNYKISKLTNIENGEFDAQAFKNFIGESQVRNIKIIKYKDHLPSTETIEKQVDINFNTSDDSLQIRFKSPESVPFYNEKNLFGISPSKNASSDPLTKTQKNNVVESCKSNLPISNQNQSFFGSNKFESENSQLLPEKNIGWELSSYQKVFLACIPLGCVILIIYEFYHCSKADDELSKIQNLPLLQ